MQVTFNPDREPNNLPSAPVGPDELAPQDASLRVSAIT
jgi:hypothetical protein